MDAKTQLLFMLSPAAKAKAAEEHAQNPTIDEQIQEASAALAIARDCFNAEEDFDKIDSYIYMMTAMEKRLDTLFSEAKRQKKTISVGA